MAALGIGARRLEKNKKSLSKYLRYVVICGYYVCMENNPTYKLNKTRAGVYEYNGVRIYRCSRSQYWRATGSNGHGWFTIGSSTLKRVVAELDKFFEQGWQTSGSRIIGPNEIGYVTVKTYAWKF
jgi:hypothetical protein